MFEEKVMSVDNAPPLVVIGCEGLWGTALSLLVVYPLAYLAPGQDNGSFEDPFDALAMIGNSTQLLVSAASFLFLTISYFFVVVVCVEAFFTAFTFLSRKYRSCP